MKDARRDFKYQLVMPEGKIKMLALPIIKELPVDPVWEKTEEKIGVTSQDGYGTGRWFEARHGV